MNIDQKVELVMDESMVHLDMLKNRWKDEKEYEDFNEYIESMKKAVEEIGVHFVALNKRFAFTWEFKGQTFKTWFRRNRIVTQRIA